MLTWSYECFFFLIIPFVSAVDLDSGTTLNTTVSNSSFTFNTINISVDEARIFNRSIELENVSYTNGDLVISISTIMNHTVVNTNFDSSAFPSITSSSTTNVEITNGFPQNLASQITFPATQCSSIGQITYTSGSGGNNQIINKGGISCSGDVATVDIDSLDASSIGSLEWTFGCSTFELVGYRLIQIAGALLVLSGSLFFLWKNGMLFEMTVGQLLTTFIIVVVAIGLFIASVDVMSSSCPI